MAMTVQDCPYCGANRVGMPIFGISVPVRDFFSSISQYEHYFAFVAASCPNCCRPVPLIVYDEPHAVTTNYPSFTSRIADLKQYHGEVGHKGFRDKVLYPSLEPTDIPAHLPDNVAKAFRQAESNVARPDHEEAAATMYRRALELALKDRFPTYTGILAARIKQLAKNSDIPQVMADWADEIRFIGNDGAHDVDGVSADELQAIRGFTDAFLRYLITLPTEVANRRTAAAKKASATP